MYGQIPYAFPNAMISSAPLASNLSNAATLGNNIAGANIGLKGLLSKINFSSILTNAQKTLNVVNQAVPLYYQVKPVFKNIKTLGKIGREFKNINTNTNSNNISNTINNNNKQYKEKNINTTNNIKDDIPTPTFFA